MFLFSAHHIPAQISLLCVVKFVVKFGKTFSSR